MELGLPIHRTKLMQLILLYYLHTLLMTIPDEIYLPNTVAILFPYLRYLIDDIGNIPLYNNVRKLIIKKPAVKAISVSSTGSICVICSI